MEKISTSKNRPDELDEFMYIWLNESPTGKT
jgi:hypothetical protein